jgi:hypothetical protein
MRGDHYKVLLINSTHINAAHRARQSRLMSPSTTVRADLFYQARVPVLLGANKERQKKKSFWAHVVNCLR